MRSFTLASFLGVSVMSIVVLVGACGSSGSSGDSPATPDASTPAPSSTATQRDDDAAPPPLDDAGTDAATDAGADADAGASCPVGAICTGTYNYAFITSTEQNITAIGGVAGADQLCNDRAQAAGLPGTYVAWISSTASDAKTRLGTASGWIRTDRRPFAASAADLFATKLLYPLRLDESGNLTAEDSAISTGTLLDGTVSNQNCGDWTLSGGSDSVTGGYPWYGSERWTIGALGHCDQDEHVYCFGKDHVAPLPSSAVKGRLAFVTSTPFDVTTGIAGADAQCQADATAASLAGTFKALLATKAASAISRFDTTGETWVRMDGAALWVSAADAAADAPLLAPVLFHADGTPVGSPWLWMGSDKLDTVGSDTCEDWSTNAGDKYGATAFAHVAGDWTYSMFSCDKSHFNAGVTCLQE